MNWEHISLAIKNIIYPALLVLFGIVIIPARNAFSSAIKRHSENTGVYLGDGLAYYFGRMFRRNLSVNIILKQYCRKCYSIVAYRYMHVPSSQDISLLTDETYVPLVLEQDLYQLKVTDEQLLEQHSRIRVHGDPGSGKSTLVKRLFRRICKRVFHNQPFSASMPIILELRNLSAQLKNVDLKEAPLPGQWLLGIIQNSLTAFEIYGLIDCFNSMLNSDGLTIFLDGLDEVSSDAYTSITREILGLSEILSAKSPSNKIILTMRTQFHYIARNDYTQQFPIGYSLKPFSLEDVYTFLLRWPFRNNAEQYAANIFAELGDQPSLRDLCRNPLILSMYVAENQSNRHLAPPDSRTAFYNKVIRELLLERRLKQIGSTEAYTKQKETREHILGAIAYRHLMTMEESANSIPWRSSIQLISNELNISLSDAEVLIGEVSKETGIISFEQPLESLRFIHLTICEYFAAIEAISNKPSGWQTVLEKHSNWMHLNNAALETRLTEVIPFLCGLMLRSDRKNALHIIRSMNDSSLYLKSFMETKEYACDEWNSLVDEEAIRLYGLMTNELCESTLKEFYLFVTCLRDAEANITVTLHSRTWQSLDNIILKLLGDHRDNVRSLLQGYAQQDGLAAIRVAALAGINLVSEFPDIVLDVCDQQPVIGMLIQRLSSNQSDSREYACLLLEAALRKQAVARYLNSHDSLPELNSLIRENALKNEWLETQLLRNRLYAQILVIALQSESSVTGWYKLHQSLRFIHGPNYYLKYRINVSLALTCIVIILMIGAMISVSFSQTTQLGAALFLLSVLASGISSLYLSRYSVYREIFQNILNIVTYSEREMTLSEYLESSRFTSVFPRWYLKLIALFIDSMQGTLILRRSRRRFIQTYDTNIKRLLSTSYVESDLKYTLYTMYNFRNQ